MMDDIHTFYLPYFVGLFNTCYVIKPTTVKGKKMQSPKYGFVCPDILFYEGFENHLTIFLSIKCEIYT